MMRRIGKAPELGMGYEGPFTRKPQENLYETAARQILQDTGHPLMMKDGAWTNGHLRFDVTADKHGNWSWNIRLASSGCDADPVGWIRWFGLWREYVLRTRDGFVFAQDCLQDIVQFCQVQNARQRAFEQICAARSS